MARAQGARAQMALAFETVYGTAPASGYTRVPFASTSLGSEQPLISSELLGYGRDPTAPIKDAVTADGDVVVPIDAAAFGFWLKAAFGEPITSGSGPWTHEFRFGELDAAVAVDRDGDARGAALRDVLRLRPRPAQLADAALGAADRHREAGRAGRGRGDHYRRRHPVAAGAEALRPLQRQHHSQRHGARQRGLGGDHLRQQPRPHRDDPERRPHRRRRSVDRRADRPGRGPLRRPGAGEPGDRRRPLRARVRLRAALGRELHLHGARRLPAAAADRDCRPAGRAGDLRLAGGPGRRLGRMCTATLVNDIEEY